MDKAERGAIAQQVVDELSRFHHPSDCPFRVKGVPQVYCGHCSRRHAPSSRPRVCARCGADLYRKQIWERRGKLLLCMACGRAGHRLPVEAH